ncbi:MAG: hypothetical protein HZA51_07015 [Planctomycetes bacterium]|nr:hypothetical protein [Planctomycetota bacterium]
MNQTVEQNKAETTEFFKQANDNFKAAFDTGMKFQNDAFKTMTEMFGRGENFGDVKNRVETLATDSINLVRKNTEQTQRFFDEGCKTGLEMIRKTFAVTENGNSKNDAFTQARDLWQGAFEAMRSNIETASRTNAQTIENWSNFFNKAMTITEKKAVK